MRYPRLKELPSSRETVDKFGGYNRNLRIKSGEFSDMENLSSDGYPALSVRKRRRQVASCPAERGKVTGVSWADSLGFIYTQGEWVYINGSQIANLGLTDTAKQFAWMGQCLVILPDMQYINMENLEDRGPLGHAVDVTEGEVTFELCDVNGEVYPRPGIGDTAPTEPADDDLWISQSSGKWALMRYSASMGIWIEIKKTYVKISGLPADSDGPQFGQYDGVLISGIDCQEAIHLNGYAVLQTQHNRGQIVVEGFIEKNVVQDCSGRPLRVERPIPIMDYVVEVENRLWGCRYGEDGHGKFVNKIYASKLGDYKNWTCFMGISTDSWECSVGSHGAFTGAAVVAGCPVFYKENMRHKVWISDTGAHQTTSTPCQGVQSSCGASVAGMDGAAIYKSRRGFCVDDGSGPEEIGQCFAGAHYRNAVGGVCGHKYYVSMQAESDLSWHLFVYDADRKLWHREDDFHAVTFSGYGPYIMAVQKDGDAILDLGGSVDIPHNMEDTVRWMAQTGEIGLESPDMKYISRITLRLSMEVGAELTVYAQYDTEPEWVALGSIQGTGLQSFSLPLRLRRCDSLRLRLEGTGDVKLYSITKTIYEGGECR